MAVALASVSLAACSGLKPADNCLPSIRCYFRRSFGLVVPGPSKARLPFFLTAGIPKATSPTAVENGKSWEADTVPTPKVIIDQDSDPDATIVEITFGDRLGTLLDTMNALKNLGLSVVKANVYLESSGKHNKFAITKASTGRKVDDPEMLEAIRLTIINNMLRYHPESSSQLAMGATFGIEPPKQIDVDIATHIDIYDDGPGRSMLVVETADRPGLLVDLVKIITDINIMVQSGGFNTEGLLAKAKFHVSYRDKPIIKSLQQVLANSLHYFLRRPTTEEDEDPRGKESFQFPLLPASRLQLIQGPESATFCNILYPRVHFHSLYHNVGIVPCTQDCFFSVHRAVLSQISCSFSHSMAFSHLME